MREEMEKIVDEHINKLFDIAGEYFKLAEEQDSEAKKSAYVGLAFATLSSANAHDAQREQIINDIIKGMKGGESLGV